MHAILPAFSRGDECEPFVVTKIWANTVETTPCLSLAFCRLQLDRQLDVSLCDAVQRAPLSDKVRCDGASTISPVI